MTVFARDVRILLDTIDRLKAQHRAGVQPPFGALDDLFEEAAAVRTGLAATDVHGLTPPGDYAQQIRRGLRCSPTMLERIDHAPAGIVRAVLDSLASGAA